MPTRIHRASLATLSTLAILFLVAALAPAPALCDVIFEDRKLLASDGATGDEFGRSVAVEEGLVAVGAPYDDEQGIDSGAAFLFNAGTGFEIHKLAPNDGQANDAFGSAIAMMDGIIAVGAPGKDDNGGESGAAYLFSAATGAQIAKLLPDDGAAGDAFGNAIAIGGGVVAVGALSQDGFALDGGAAYLFDVSTGAQIDKLMPDEGGNRNFGVSIAMDGGIVVVGARMHYDTSEGFTLGAAYLFDVSSGNQLHRLESDNNTWTDFFGDAVDIDDGIVAVGAWARSIYYDHSGAAYLFDAVSGMQLAYIVPADGHDRDHFGKSVAIDGGLLAIGADEDDDSAWSGGSAYLYDASDATQIDKLLVSDGALFDRFGSSIAVGSGLIASGAIGFGGSGTQTGYAAVYDVREQTSVDSDLPFAARGLLPAQSNPFNPKTTLRFALAKSGRARLDIFDAAGRRLATLADGFYAAGEHSAAWDGRDAAGQSLPSGLYFARLRANGRLDATKLVLMK